MATTFNEVNSIVKTLPIGYYLKRNLKVKLDEFGDNTFIDLMNDEITISYPNVETILKDTTINTESAIRGLLYHEVSHAILTPKTMTHTDIINIFEDERIETILKDYYMEVNFKKNIIAVCDFKGEAPKTAKEMFFNVVRFRQGPKEFTDRVTEIIHEFRNMTCMDKSTWYYESAVNDLWHDIEMYFDEHKEETKTMDAPTTPDKKSTDSFDAFDSFDESDDEDESDEDESDEDGEDDSTESDESESSDPTGTTDHIDSDDESDDPDTDTDSSHVDEPETESPLTSEEINKTINDITHAFDNSTFENKLFEILNIRLKKQTHNGSSINSYSGKFDPRSVTRTDCKYFTQSNRLGHLKSNSKVNINLFVDQSGSFYRSEKIVNQFLKSLSNFEKLNPDFHFNLITIGMSEILHNKNDRILNVGGGNVLTEKIFDIVKRVQEKNMTNINIVMFDGYALTDCSYGCAKNFKAFNDKSFTIISDRSNEVCIDAYAPNAKKMITKSYAADLINTTLEAIKVGA